MIGKSCNHFLTPRNDGGGAGGVLMYITVGRPASNKERQLKTKYPTNRKIFIDAPLDCAAVAAVAAGGVVVVAKSFIECPNMA